MSGLKRVRRSAGENLPREDRGAGGANEECARKPGVRSLVLLRHLPNLGVICGAAIVLGTWLSAAANAGGTVRVRVTDAGSGEPLPCRLTVVDAGGELATMIAAKEPWLAYRPGVLYTGSGAAAFELQPGRYTLYANRGLEYGLEARPLEITPGKAVSLDLKLAREVNTDGYVAADTHIHTLTYAGHGDATIQERMATIAGEGIELAIATEHNHHADYAPVAKETRTESYFTPVIGNEVTTKQGHFNAFPIKAGSRVPNFQITDWNLLLPEIRATPGVRVVVLNHPADSHSGFIPTDPKRLHPASGEPRDGASWAIDGIEVVTSAALHSDIMRPYRDWFALLNRGHNIAGIGSSDSHDVNRFILGQGRTYVASKASRPDRIDVQEACDNILAGKVLASMGLLTEAWVDGAYGVGSLAAGSGAEMKVRVRVQGPRWISADRLEIFQDGENVATRAILPAKTGSVKADVTVTLPRPKHDAWIVAIASGPGVMEHYWPTARPYQPTRPDWDPRVIGSTNFIRVDGDGDGKYSSPLDYARAVFNETGAAPDKLTAALGRYDTAVSIQAASVCRERGIDLNAGPFRRAIDNSALHVRHGFVAYQALTVK